MILAWLSVAFLCGVVVGVALPALVLPMLAAAVILACCAWLARRSRLKTPLLLGCALCLGLARSPHQGPPSPGDLRFYNGGEIQAIGQVSAEPDVRDTGANYVISVTRVLVSRHWHTVSGSVIVHVARFQHLDYGDSVLLRGKLLQPEDSPAIPYRTILARQGIGSQMRFPVLIDRGPGRTGVWGWAVPLRERMEAAIDRSLPQPEAAFLIAIVLGSHSAAVGDLVSALVATGLSHLIAISGIKIAIIAGTVNQLALRAWRRTLALIASLVVLWSYVAVTGFTPAGMRSGAMWTLAFFATYLGRRTLAVLSLCAVVAFMVALDPTLPWDTGFQMSAIGTGAILAFAAWLDLHLRPVPSPVREAFGTTLAAQIGTLPIVMATFHVVSLTSPFTNALVLPLVPALIAFGLALVLTSVPFIAAPLAALLYALLHFILAFTRSVASLGGAIHIGALAPIAVLAYYAVLLLLAVAVLRRSMWHPSHHLPGRGREFAVTGVLAALILSTSLIPAHASSPAEMNWVGSGNALLVRANGAVVLIDGSARPFQFAERLGSLLPFRQTAIDLVVVTDPRASNITGLMGLASHYRIRHVLDVAAEYPSTTYVRWRSSLRTSHVPAFALRRGATVQVAGVRIDALLPDALYPDPNDCIPILSIHLGHTSVLFAGGASTREQAEAVVRQLPLRADILISTGKVLLPAFVHAVHPERAFVASPPLAHHTPGSILLTGPMKLARPAGDPSKPVSS